MSSNFLFRFLLLLLLLLNPVVINRSGKFSASVSVADSRPLDQNVPKYMDLKPKKGQGRSFQWPEAEACLPKGFRRSSAPSRYVNYQPLGSTCYSGKVVNEP
ncbi:hypothetical protein SESBI_06660 [Sesbania bispinosa]|nr:hypothetical protein SESBI_06660 [Sesbania bispinosa]